MLAASLLRRVRIQTGHSLSRPCGARVPCVVGIERDMVPLRAAPGPTRRPASAGCIHPRTLRHKAQCDQLPLAPPVFRRRIPPTGGGAPRSIPGRRHSLCGAPLDRRLPRLALHIVFAFLCLRFRRSNHPLAVWRCRKEEMPRCNDCQGHKLQRGTSNGHEHKHQPNPRYDPCTLFRGLGSLHRLSYAIHPASTRKTGHGTLPGCSEGKQVHDPPPPTAHVLF